MPNYTTLAGASINTGPGQVFTPTEPPTEYLWAEFGLTDIDPVFRAAGEDIATVIRILYDLDHSTGEFRRAVILEAPDAIEEYGRIEHQVEARWLRDTRVAAGLGQRLLEYRARSRWELQGTVAIRHEIPPGGLVEINHPRAPVSGKWRVTNVATEPATASASLTAEANAGPVPRVRLAQLVSQADGAQAITATGTHADGQVTFTVLDGNRPLSGAAVTLNDTTTRDTDRRGRVSFSGEPGRHTISVEVPGGQVGDMDVLATTG